MSAPNTNPQTEATGTCPADVPTIHKSVGWSVLSPIAIAGLSGIPRAELHQHSELVVDGSTYRRSCSGDWLGPRSDGTEHPEFLAGKEVTHG